MKNATLFLLLFCSIAVQAQQTKPTAKTKATTTATAATFKNMEDSASYVIGMYTVNFYTQQGITKVNPAMVAKAISDLQAKRKPLLNDNAANSVIMRYIGKEQEAKSKPNIEAGNQFLVKNKTKPGVVTTTSGLQYEVIKQGSGPKPTLTDSVVCHYAGTLLDGTEFDNSYKRGEPITFPVTGVIKGWTEALQLMPVGSKYKLYIPHQLAYGTNATGPIPAGSVLTFEVELLKIAGK